MTGIEFSNALVESAEIYLEADHGVYTSRISLDYGGTHQCAGLYGLGKYIKSKGRQVPNEPLIKNYQLLFEAIWGCKLEDMKGKMIRAIHGNDRVWAIGHALQDNWLYFPDFFKTRVPLVWKLAPVWRAVIAQQQKENQGLHMHDDIGTVYLDGVYLKATGYLWDVGSKDERPEKITKCMLKEAKES
jgi:hypothetical protein